MADILKESQHIINAAERLRSNIPVDHRPEQRVALRAILFSVHILARDLDIDLPRMEG